MNLHKFSLSASTLCATGTLMVLGGFLAVNLAGCGGGGGGTSIATPTQAPFSGTVRLLNSTGAEVTSGTLSLSPNTGPAISVPLTANGFSLANIARGRYTASIDLGQGTVQTVIDVTNNGILLANTENPANFSFNNNANANDTRSSIIRGTVLLNTPGNNVTPACDTIVVPLTDRFLVQVRDTSIGNQPVIARLIRATGTTGDFAITLPYRPITFQVEVAAVSTSVSVRRYAGRGSLLTFSSGSATISGVNICTNFEDDPTAAAPSVPTQPTPTPLPTSDVFQPFPFGTQGALAATATARVEATLSARATATAGAIATATAQSNATATATAAVQATSQAQATATANAQATAVATTGVTTGGVR